MLYHLFKLLHIYAVVTKNLNLKYLFFSNQITSCHIILLFNVWSHKQNPMFSQQFLYQFCYILLVFIQLSIQYRIYSPISRIFGSEKSYESQGSDLQARHMFKFFFTVPKSRTFNVLTPLLFGKISSTIPIYNRYILI